MPWPLGIFSRGRRDWSIEAQQWCYAQESSVGAGGPQVNFNNNSALGQRIAIYALIPWTGMNPPLVQVVPVFRAEDNLVQTPYQVHVNNPPIAGHLSRANRVDTAIGPAGFVCIANGSIIAMPDGVPLWILDPGWQLVVYVSNPAFLNPLSGALSCAVLWGYW